MLRRLLFISLFSSAIVAAPIQTEPPSIGHLDTLDHLIAVTKENLATQRELKNELLQFQLLRRGGDQSKKTLIAMADLAASIMRKIEEQNLQYAFSQDYLKDLEVFAEVGNKRQIP